MGNFSEQVWGDLRERGHLVSKDVAQVVVRMEDGRDRIAHLADWTDGKVFGMFWRDDINWGFVAAYDDQGNVLDQRVREDSDVEATA